ncbi:MAG: hypothetical protein NTZ26_02855 [Candidatus Aminicenantes bacterium]|nr:hypothetical protein [Candidatus Aminicenantes bacterium]
MKGISSEFVRRGTSLIVQTQDVPGATSYIETLIYSSGRLIYSRRKALPSLRLSASWPDQLNKLLTDVHGMVLEDLAAGRLDRYLPGPSL